MSARGALCGAHSSVRFGPMHALILIDASVADARGTIDVERERQNNPGIFFFILHTHSTR
jgi:hypothetical protein